MKKVFFTLREKDKNFIRVKASLMNEILKRFTALKKKWLVKFFIFFFGLILKYTLAITFFFFAFNKLDSLKLKKNFFEKVKKIKTGDDANFSIKFAPCINHNFPRLSIAWWNWIIAPEKSLAREVMYSINEQ